LYFDIKFASLAAVADDNAVTDDNDDDDDPVPAIDESFFVEINLNYNNKSNEQKNSEVLSLLVNFCFCRLRKCFTVISSISAFSSL